MIQPDGSLAPHRIQKSAQHFLARQHRLGVARAAPANSAIPAHRRIQCAQKCDSRCEPPTLPITEAVAESAGRLANTISPMFCFLSSARTLSHELFSLFRALEKIAIVARRGAQERRSLPRWIGSQRRHAAQRVALVISQKKKRAQRRVVSAVHSQRPLVGIKDLRLLRAQHQCIPLAAQVSIFRNLFQQD